MSYFLRKIFFFMCLNQGRGEPMDLYANTNGVITDLTPRGVDAQRCHQLVYQVKGCQDHGFSLLDGSGTELIQFLIGGWYNGRSRLIVSPTSGYQEPSTPQILNCDEYRWFWISWGNGRVMYGKGTVPGVNGVFDLEDTTGDAVKKLGLRGVNNAGVWTRLGETSKGRFERVAEEGKFADGMMEEIATSWVNCTAMCSRHTNCGMFSYSEDLGLCELFDRMTSSFTMTSPSGWRSWKMLYCYP